MSNTVEQKSLLKMHSANAFQTTNSGNRSDWAIRKNGAEGAVMCRMPSTIGDNDMFSIMDFMKSVELEAFNTGIKFQKDKQNQFLKTQIDELKNAVKLLEEENVRLAEILEIHLPNEE